MNVVFASSEVVPFAKTGGLADVSGALPRELASLGNQVTVFMPAYACVFHSGQEINATDIEFTIPIGNKLVPGRLLVSKIPGSEVPIYFVHNSDYFEREGLYVNGGDDYTDNCERFVFFSRGVLEAIRLLDLNPDLIHVNDWQTGIIPALLKAEYSISPVYENVASLITIHNLAYQGSFWHWDMLVTGLDWKYFNWREMEFYGRLNLLKTGLVFADAINTVSPTYAAEIQTAEQGYGLDGVLRHRGEVLTGILNGIDTEEWNPACDPHLAVNYDAGSWQTGKPACKQALQEALGLARDPDVPLIGIIGRLASQKGWSLILPVMKNWLESVDVQFAVLGTGDPDYHAVLASLNRQYPSRLSARLEFSTSLAHQIEAGADMFLMPSHYEPCGLNQMYSMAYGTVPIVRRTGGLADTVIDANAETLASGSATGFSFDKFEVSPFESAMIRAVNMFNDDRDSWIQLVNNGMNQDWSWQASARKYQRYYEKAIAIKQSLQETA